MEENKLEEMKQEEKLTENKEEKKQEKPAENQEEEKQAEKKHEKLAEKHVREYVAFISYRHTELDKKVAKKIHTMVERYVIPKELRKDGKKKLGKVFRDEEELPVSSNLTESIQTALDHSKFLIVICTPNLLKSIWCEREIAYFIEKNGRDHVVGVLVDGTPEESFPKLLTQTVETDENGNESIREVEPLAANLTDVNHHFKESRLRKEAVRLYAALLGCPFDSLWQREKRQKMRKLVALMALVMVVALAFSTSIYLKNREISARNQQIEEQNVQIQSQNEEIKIQYVEIQDKNADLKRSEAEALIRNGELLYEKGDTRGAINAARLAVSTPEGRESFAQEAEYLLYRALGAGQNSNSVRTVGVIEQEDDVQCMALSKDGSRVYTLGNRGYVRCFTTEDCRQIWMGDCLSRSYYYDVTAKHRLLLLEDEGLLLCCLEECVTALKLEDGSLAWTHELGKSGSADFACLSEDGKTLAVIDLSGDFFEEKCVLRMLDTTNGEIQKEISLAEFSEGRADMIAFGDKVGAFSEDGRYFTFMLYENRYNNYGRKGHVFLADLEELTVKLLYTADYTDYSDYPFTIGMICHADTQSILALHYRPDHGGVAMEQIFFDGTRREESPLVPMSLPERGMTNPYATTFLVGDNNALMASCLGMNLLYRVDNGEMVNASQTASESVLKRSWIDPESYARSDLAADGNHYAWYGPAGYSLAPFSAKKHIVLLEITENYATSDGGYGYVMDENLVQVILCDDNMRRLYVQRPAKDPEVKAPDWTKKIEKVGRSRLGLRIVNEDTLAVIQDLDYSTAAARIYIIDVKTDQIKKSVDVSYEDFGTYGSYYQLYSAMFWPDERHFTFEKGLKLYVYDMETKKCSLLIEEAAERRIEQHYCTLGSGEVLQAYLTYKKDAEFGEAGGRVMWQIGDGEIMEAIAQGEEEWGGPYGTFGDGYLTVGENGYLLVGSCEGENERRNKLIAIDVRTKARYEIEDKGPEQEQGTVVLGKEKPVFAVLDADGILRIYDITSQAMIREIKLLEGQVIADFAFAKNDEVIALYSRDGWLFLYEVATGRELVSCEMGEAATASATKTLTCYDDPARKRLFVTVTDENGLALDTDTWKQTMILYDETDVFFPKENVAYKINREDSLYENSDETVLKHVPLTLDELILKAY